MHFVYKSEDGYTIETYGARGNRTYHCKTRKDLRVMLGVLKRKLLK